MPVWKWLYDHYFRVQTSGWHHIPNDENVVFVGSHNGGIAAPDMFMMMYDWFCRFGLERPVYGLMHPRVWQASPAVAKLATRVGAVMSHPKMAIAALQQNASVLIYPGGAEDIFVPIVYAIKFTSAIGKRLSGLRCGRRSRSCQLFPTVPMTR